MPSLLNRVKEVFCNYFLVYIDDFLSMFMKEIYNFLSQIWSL